MNSLRYLTAAAVAAATLTAVTLASAAPRVVAARSLWQQADSLKSAISWHRSRTWHYQDRAGVARTRTVYAERRTRSVPFLRWVDHLWSQRQVSAKKLAAQHHSAIGGIAHLALWECIHRGEGAWNANTGNGYYGGLQMTSGWGGVARPDLLSPTQQMALAERQYRASGYSHSWLGGQWPNTSPPCMGDA